MPDKHRRGRLAGSTITDINFYVVLDHTDLSDLQITLDNPSGGGPITLFSGLSSTCNAGLRVTIDDEATRTFAELQGNCSSGVVLSGTFQGQAMLNSLIDMNPLGTWTVRVQDNNSAGGGGTIQKLVLVLGQDGGIVTFPGDMVSVISADEDQFILTRTATPLALLLFLDQHLDDLAQEAAIDLGANFFLNLLQDLMASFLLRLWHIIDHTSLADRAGTRAVARQMRFVQLEFTQHVGRLKASL